MALKAYTAEATLDEIAETITQADKRMVQALQGITVAKATLDGMAATYGSFITALEAEATANPDNEVWTQLQAKKDLFVAEFGELKTYAASLKIAADGVSKP